MEGDSEVTSNEPDDRLARQRDGTEPDHVPPDQPGRRRRRIAGATSGARVRVTAALTILGVWGLTTLADIASKDYNPPEGVNTIALAAATYLFGSALLRENRDDQGDPRQ